MMHQKLIFLVGGTSLYLIAGCGSSMSQESDSSSETSSETGECECPSCPCSEVPHWVLRDKDGSLVDALVQPRCGRLGVPLEHKCNKPFDFDTNRQFPCARIISHKGKYINLDYELSTGHIELCMFDDPTHSPPYTKAGFYSNAQCEGDRHKLLFNVEGSEHTQSRWVAWRGFVLWYDYGINCLPGASIWYYDSEEDECLSYSGSGTFCPIQPIPDWVRGLLPNPPYTLTLEHE